MIFVIVENDISQFQMSKDFIVLYKIVIPPRVPPTHFLKDPECDFVFARVQNNNKNDSHGLTARGDMTLHHVGTLWVCFLFLLATLRHILISKIAIRAATRSFAQPSRN